MPVPTLVIAISTLGILDPLVSVTVPEIVAPTTWAKLGRGERIVKSRAARMATNPKTNTPIPFDPGRENMSKLLSACEPTPTRASGNTSDAEIQMRHLDTKVYLRVSR